jgi:hypothetical protein
LMRVRLYITDTVNHEDQPGIFDDQEILAFLTANGGNEFEAGALAYETWARSRARLAKSMARDNFRTERHAIDHLMEAARKLREAGALAASGGTGWQTGSIITSGEHLDYYRVPWPRAGGW